MNLFGSAEYLRLRSLILAMSLTWEPGRMFEGGVTVLLDGRLYRAVRPSWNVYPRSRAGGEFWKELGNIEDCNPHA